MAEVVWQGINTPQSLSAEQQSWVHALADAAKAYRWTDVLAQLEAWPEGINASRVGGLSGFTPLHQAAHGGAPAEVVQALIALGAFRTLRTLRTSDGHRAVDLARRYGHLQLLELLEPQTLVHHDADKLALIQQGVHAVIRGREHVDALLQAHDMRLPPVEVLTEIPGHGLWFPVPGMYGGFWLRLGGVADEPVCLVESWVRVVEGSTERRLVTTGGTIELPEKDSGPLPMIVSPPSAPVEDKLGSGDHL